MAACVNLTPLIERGGLQEAGDGLCHSDGDGVVLARHHHDALTDGGWNTLNQSE